MLNKPQEQLISTLTKRVRVLSESQTAELLGQQECKLEETLTRLSRENLIERFDMLARPEIELPEPVFTWSPGDSEPEFGPVAYHLRHRWKQAVKVIPLVVATCQAKRRYGGYIGGRKPRQSETTHDIHLSRVYIQLCSQGPDLARHWISEHQIAAERVSLTEIVPDSMIRRPDSPRPAADNRIWWPVFEAKPSKLSC